jgi:hypothetical protein
MMPIVSQVTQPQTTPPPSLAICSDTLFLDELYRRVSLGKICLELTHQGENWAGVRAFVATSMGDYSATFMAYAPVIGHFNGGCCSSGADACDSVVTPV